jgi:hypothetical protein
VVVPFALRRRLPAASALVLTCIAGPTFRAFTEGALAKAGGDILYAVGVYALVLLIRPGLSRTAAAAAASALCWSVEFAQLTPFPAEASRHSALGRLVLGSTFYPADLASYLVGVLLATAVLGFSRRMRLSRDGP